MSFEFSTREQREAWRVIGRLMVSHPGLKEEPSAKNYEEMNDAAARFDAREATCGIKPLSGAHARLIVAEAEKLGKDSGYYHCSQNGLLRGSFTTDKGSRVLANLNAMCKAQS